MEVLKLTIAGNPEYIGVPKLAVETLAIKLGFDMEQVEDIGMAVAEACKHITCHGFDSWSNTYQLTAMFENSTLTIKVTDEKSERTLSKDGCICLDCPCEGDLGLHLLETWMDQVTVEKEKAEPSFITMSKKL